MKNTITNFVFLMNYLVGVLILSVMQNILPEKYFGDGQGIKELIPNSELIIDLTSPDSFSSTAYLYKMMGLGTVLPDWVAGFVSYSIPFFALVLVLRSLHWKMNGFSVLLFSLWNILLAIYLGTFSKEPFAFVLVTIILFLGKSNRTLLFALGIALVYALIFRIYWLIVIGFFVINLFLIKKKYSLALVLMVQLLVALAVFKLANIATGQFLSDVRYLVNERSGADEVVTLVQNIFPNDSTVHDWMNALFTWGMLLFPFYLFLTGEIQHIGFMLFQLVNLAFFILVVSYLSKRRSMVEAVFGDAWRRRVDVSVAWCLSFSFVQGIFEPDFGSFSRHQIILFPMWFSLLGVYFGLKVQRNNSFKLHDVSIEGRLSC